MPQHRKRQLVENQRYQKSCGKTGQYPSEIITTTLSFRDDFCFLTKL
jgi:hypothetical protein